MPAKPGGCRPGLTPTRAGCVRRAWAEGTTAVSARSTLDERDERIKSRFQALDSSPPSQSSLWTGRGGCGHLRSPNLRQVDARPTPTSLSVERRRRRAACSLCRHVQLAAVARRLELVEGSVTAALERAQSARPCPSPIWLRSDGPGPCLLALPPDSTRHDGPRGHTAVGGAAGEPSHHLLAPSPAAERLSLHRQSGDRLRADGCENVRPRVVCGADVPGTFSRRG